MAYQWDPCNLHQNILKALFKDLFKNLYFCEHKSFTSLTLFQKIEVPMTDFGGPVTKIKHLKGLSLVKKG